MTTEEQTSEDMLLLENDPDFCRKEVDDNLWADPQMLALLSTEYQKFNDQAKLNIGNKSLFRLQTNLVSTLYNKHEIIDTTGSTYLEKSQRM